MTIKIYEPVIAQVNFYCSICDNQVSAGDNCTNVAYHKDDNNGHLKLDTICEQCLYEEVES